MSTLSLISSYSYPGSGSSSPLTQSNSDLNQGSLENTASAISNISKSALTIAIPLIPKSSLTLNRESFTPLYSPSSSFIDLDETLPILS
jgi:hypothetical protein